MQAILEAIPSTEPCDFYEFCRDYVDRPEKGDKNAWRELFVALEKLRDEGLVDIVRDGDNRVESLQLTASGVAKLKELRH